MRLEEARQQIDELDGKITELFCKRMDLCCEVGKIKAANGLSADVPEREREIMRRLTSELTDDKKVLVKQLYNTVFSVSKACQNNVVSANSATVDAIKNALATRQDFPLSATVACQGAKGSYSSVAADKLFEFPEVSFFKTFESVFGAIESGLCDYGVLPIENSNAGSVLQVYDLMQKHRCYVVKSVRVPVKHALVGLRGTDLRNVKKVISHEQGLLQCANFVKTLGVETQVAENTAVAARTVAELDDPAVAAICSEECAKIYGLKILQTNVQDNGFNYTRFICLSRKLQIFSGANKISVLLTTSNTPGSLFAVLSRFAALNLNLTKLESRPVANSDFEFSFYFDIEGDISDARVQNLLADLENTAQTFVFLGSYKCL